MNAKKIEQQVLDLLGHIIDGALGRDLTDIEAECYEALETALHVARIHERQTFVEIVARNWKVQP